MPMRDVIVRSFVQAGPPEARWTGYGLTLVLGALWASLTSMLAGALAILFVADLGLGVVRALHQGGLRAFDASRFARSWLKFGAAILGIALGTAGDVLLHVAGLPGDATPLTSSVLFGASWGFFWSGAQNLVHFFPELERRIDQVLQRGSALGAEVERR